MASNKVCIVGYARTAMGGLSGSLASQTAPELGAVAIKGALERAGVAAEAVQEVYMGHVLSAGVGQAPAKQAALKAGILPSVPCTSVNKVCSSGMKAIHVAAASILIGQSDLVVAGGMESMTGAPFLLPAATRGGLRYGNSELRDSCASDGLTDPYGDQAMGCLAEECAEEHGISLVRACPRGCRRGVFADEIVPVVIKSRKGETVVDADDEPARFNPAKFPSLRTVFKRDGTVTAGNASTISDGAAAVILASEAKAAELGLTVYATIEGMGDASQDPAKFTTSPAHAIPVACKRAGIELADADLVEINEAFAVVALANMALLGLDDAKVNIYGGAVSIGHPLGCSGARIVVTLLNALIREGKSVGIAGICNGGGGASALVIKRPAA
ncbi:cytosolic acetoacetyl-coenzyme A thiolase [Thecamonas trahens ATCC 50062]|uniref:acetyl-CoA C-acetyltransferase n=1 Tax=Thecamonas trahens ATCC 50062 TaxID=461836 RepID=A0A0L0DGB2_THETB|nr:cytosolic acetoacetyl-coenzyme A thiolase [Thecamonas trahens ATCC 50062]KNC51369.1 cytosolic acetoacetyl-coenzyme A thiolase [Thecamonas trahens ATCC 50062]|eukprot:XP_013756287.1 cytosolic acetoacetyl-coenzyme A thiolase [Thecamonas trahens ATCC 50062]